MEILTLSGYTDEEKVGIARDHLVAKQLMAHGIAATGLSFEPEAIRQIVRGYTREAGVRSLDREIAAVARKVARRIAEGQREPIRITADNLAEYVGRPRLFDEVAERTTRPRVATGLAWTPVGGDVLFVEVTVMPSSEDASSSPDVMRESAQAAVSDVCSNAEALDIDPKIFEHRTIHVHVPVGGHPQGRTVGRGDHRDRTGVARHPTAGAERSSDDGRDHPPGESSSRRGIKEKVLARIPWASARSSCPDETSVISRTYPRSSGRAAPHAGRRRRGSSPPCPHARLGGHPWCCEMKERSLRPQHLRSKGTSR